MRRLMAFFNQYDIALMLIYMEDHPYPLAHFHSPDRPFECLLLSPGGRSYPETTEVLGTQTETGGKLHISTPVCI
jgi:hypothetical protein